MMDSARCPLRIQASIEAYVRGLPTGSFLRSVLENNLCEAIVRADEDNLPLLPHIVAYVYENVPGGAWGSKDAVDRWLRKMNNSEDALRYLAHLSTQPSELNYIDRIDDDSDRGTNPTWTDDIGVVKEP